VRSSVETEDASKGAAAVGVALFAAAIDEHITITQSEMASSSRPTSSCPGTRTDGVG
jgi:hypothetical protein